MGTLSISFGEKTKKGSGKITDRIKTFENACKEHGIDPSGMLKIESDDPLMIKHLNAIGAFAKLTIIASALNEGWEPDWNNGSQSKWYPWFEYKSGFGFSITAYDCWYSRAAVGSRLCFKTSELAEYAGKQFEAIYQDFLTL